MNAVFTPKRFLRKYAGLFAIRFSAGLQYRTAAWAGVSTQFFWGFMTVLLYKAFFEGDPAAFPMGLSQVITYMWLRQAFLALFNSWTLDGEILTSITGGNVAYELARPMDLYSMWFARTLSGRLAAVSLRFIPVLLVASLVPSPYGMTLPATAAAFFGFLTTMLLGALVTCAAVMLIYIVTFLTMQPMGVRMIFVTLLDFCAGGLIPLPFFPARLSAFLEITPFGAMSNVPFRIYSGHIAGWDAVIAGGLQVFWLMVLVWFGRMLMKKALKRAVIQGG